MYEKHEMEVIIFDENCAFSDVTATSNTIGSYPTQETAGPSDG